MKRRRSVDDFGSRGRIAAATSHRLNLSSICDGNMNKLLQSHAQAVGVPPEFLFFPLLSSFAGVMGNTFVQVNSDWLEPVVLWTAIVAAHGTRKTSVLNRIAERLADAQRTSASFNVRDFLLPDELEVVYRTASNFSLGLFEDVYEVLRELLATTEHKAFSVHQLKNLHDNPLLKSRLSVGGFVHVGRATDVADASLSLADPLFDRLLLSCPEQVAYHYANLRVPMPGNTPSLQDLFGVMQNMHNQTAQSRTVYRLPPSASEAFISHYNRFVDWKGSCADAMQQRVLAKAPGLLARLACVFSAVRQALHVVTARADPEVVAWSLDVTPADVESASSVLNHCICTKFVLQMSQAPVEVPRMFPDAAAATAAHPPELSPFARNCGEMRAAQAIGVSFVNGPAVFPSPIQVQGQRELAGLPVGWPGEALTVHQRAPVNGTPTTRDGGPANHRTPSPLSTPEVSDGDEAALAIQVVSVKTESHSARVSPQGSYCPSPDLPLAPADGGEISFSQVQSAMEQNAPDAMHLFVTTCGRQMKRLLEYRGKLTPSVMSQRHLMPSLTKEETDMRQSGNRFPVTLALQFLHVISFLGFGEVGQQNLSNNRRSTYFYKKPYYELTLSQKELLHTISVSPDAYMESFNEPEESQQPLQNVPR